MKKYILPALLAFAATSYAATPTFNVHVRDEVASYDIDNIASITFEDVTKWTTKTIVGTGVRSNNDGQGLEAQIASPQGMTFGPDGKLYICAQNRETGGTFKIRVLDKDLNLTTLNTTAVFNAPWGCAFDHDGNLIAASKGNAKVYRINTSTGAATEITDGGAWNNPMGVAVDSEGAIYVAERNAKKIRKIAKDGTVTNYTIGKAQGPCAIAVDAKGNMYVANQLDYILYKITPDGTTTTVFGNGVKPTADTWSDGKPGDLSEATMGTSFNIHIASDGVMYFTDVDFFCVRELVPGPDGDYSKGTLRTIGGQPTVSGTADGVGTEATFNAGGGIVERDGVLYVGDNGGNTVRTITAE